MVHVGEVLVAGAQSGRSGPALASASLFLLHYLNKGQLDLNRFRKLNSCLIKWILESKHKYSKYINMPAIAERLPVDKPDFLLTPLTSCWQLHKKNQISD